MLHDRFRLACLTKDRKIFVTKQKQVMQIGALVLWWTNQNAAVDRLHEYNIKKLQSREKMLILLWYNVYTLMHILKMKYIYCIYKYPDYTNISEHSSRRIVKSETLRNRWKIFKYLWSHNYDLWTSALCQFTCFTQ